jgi:hypothetical protein
MLMIAGGMVRACLGEEEVEVAVQAVVVAIHLEVTAAGMGVAILRLGFQRRLRISPLTPLLRSSQGSAPAVACPKPTALVRPDLPCHRGRDAILYSVAPPQTILSPTHGL